MAKKRPERTGIMLCYPTDPGRVSRLGERMIVQPKYRGERAHVEWFAGEPFLISSYGNEIKFMEHIKDRLMKVAEVIGQAPFDGELYTHGWEQEEISGILRSTVNKHPDAEGLEYHIFDLKAKEACEARIAMIGHLRMCGVLGDEKDILQVSPSYVVGQGQWMDYAAGFVEFGYEGIILRKLSAPWEAKRTVNILKFKPTEKDDYLILAVNEAIDKNGQLKGMVGSFLVKAKDVDESFKVGAGKMKHSRRVELWQAKHTIIGKMLEVKHELIRTSGGLPVCAVAVDLKEL